MKVRPISLKEANTFIVAQHRHNKQVQGHKFSIAAESGGATVGVATCGRPVSRHLDDGMTLEITRVCTDGTYNACSFLYGACARIAKEMGYKKVITYTLITEPGTSCKAAGFKVVGQNKGGDWNVKSRPRELIEPSLFGEIQKYSTVEKIRWEKQVND